MAVVVWKPDLIVGPGCEMAGKRLVMWLGPTCLSVATQPEPANTTLATQTRPCPFDCSLSHSSRLQCCSVDSLPLLSTLAGAARLPHGHDKTVSPNHGCGPATTLDAHHTFESLDWMSFALTHAWVLCSRLATFGATKRAPLGLFLPSPVSASAIHGPSRRASAPLTSRWFQSL